LRGARGGRRASASNHWSSPSQKISIDLPQICFAWLGLGAGLGLGSGLTLTLTLILTLYLTLTLTLTPTLTLTLPLPLAWVLFRISGTSDSLAVSEALLPWLRSEMRVGTTAGFSAAAAARLPPLAFFLGGSAAAPSPSAPASAAAAAAAAAAASAAAVAFECSNAAARVRKCSPEGATYFQLAVLAPGWG